MKRRAFVLSVGAAATLGSARAAKPAVTAEQAPEAPVDPALKVEKEQPMERRDYALPHLSSGLTNRRF